MSRRVVTSLEASPLVAGFDLLTLHACAMAVLGSGAGGVHAYAQTIPLLSIAALVCFSLCGLYRSWSRRPALRLIAALLSAQFLYITVWMSLSGWAPRWGVSHRAILMAAGLQIVILSMERLLLRALVRRNSRPERAVLLARHAASGGWMRGELARECPGWLDLRDCLAAADFLALADQQMVWDTVLVAQDTPERSRILRRVSGLGKTVLLLPDCMDLWIAGAHAVEIDDHLVLELRPPHLQPAQRSIKRLIDVGGALALLVVSAPVLLAAAIGVRLSSAGPVILRQTRVGANGKEYRLLKLRTMVADAERQTGPVLAGEKDPRVTRVGRLLRRMRIDELPQLINVLAGEMSLVGPRPERPHFVRIFREQLPAYELRLAVKPGITGLAQISGRYSTTPELKLRFDLRYIYNYSLLLDLQILFKTVLTVLAPKRAQCASTSSEPEREGGPVWRAEGIGSAPAPQE